MAEVPEDSLGASSHSHRAVRRSDVGLPVAGRRGDLDALRVRLDHAGRIAG
ncbi:hypothetical protein [Nocardioides plantarum]|uniref:hypothetical protein n=1 Tax=Nocardioides plantarum TaxID=29299 RepID=UPI003618A12B